MKRKVLFICVLNSARSQMAAALLNKIREIDNQVRRFCNEHCAVELQQP